jgi:hypothetical protein
VNQFQKNVLFAGGAVTLVICITLGLYFGIQSHIAEQNRATAEQKTAWHNENIRSLKALSAVGILSTEEQQRLDVAGDDPDRVQQALLDIHQGRMTYWQAGIDDAHERARKLSAIYGTDESQYYGGQIQEAAISIKKDESNAELQLAGYTEAYGQIQAWRPVSFEQYQSSPKQPNGATPKTEGSGSNDGSVTTSKP